ncbi:MAG: hypothetical protein K2I77_03605, partial [Anaeroplasmataceae bacterium]|nr:hypothetical protein [Anaeroplasmataceae bacterium]
KNIWKLFFKINFIDEDIYNEIQKRKRLLKTGWIILYMIILCNLCFGIPFYRITFIDVGQGDSILIETPFQKQNILIDSYNN